jgi:NAD(P)-dependent dehydrogenase (short-subunit alcohol dehydrogenase family)
MIEYRVTGLSIIATNVLVFLALAGQAVAAENEAQQAVLVTGASSGIGRNIAERLASEGYFVYAGARKEEDLRLLSEIDNMQGVRLDVTIQSDIDTAVKTVEAGGRGLWGVVNNAGVVVMGPLAEMEESELEFLFDVNVYGPYRIVKAFAPLIVASKGRIANISSLAGITSPSAYGAYSMSKHAIEAFTDSLAVEMGTVGVHVSAVAPGGFNSNIVAAHCERRRNQGNDPGESLFPELAAELAAVCADDDYYQLPEPDPVADAVLHALFADDPRARYLAPSDPRQPEFILRNILNDLAVLSDGVSYGFSRQELIDLLDEALAPSERD